MTKFRILFGVNLLILAFAMWQCLTIATSSLIQTSADGQVTVIPMDRWLVVSPMAAILVFVIVFLGGAEMLRRRGRTGLATLVLLVPAVPVVLGGLAMVGLMILFWLGTPSR